MYMVSFSPFSTYYDQSQSDDRDRLILRNTIYVRGRGGGAIFQQNKISLTNRASSALQTLAFPTIKKCVNENKRIKKLTFNH